MAIAAQRPATQMMRMLSVQDDPLARLRLLQLVSPSLPVGGFTYSQGLEWAVEAGWVDGVDALQDWLLGLIEDGLVHLDLALLARMHRACAAEDPVALEALSRRLLAARETHELRAEERNRSRALLSLLRDLGIDRARRWRDALAHCQAAPFALAAVTWGIGERDCLLGYAWSWLEGQIAAAVKLIPLGQTDGQRVQLSLAARLPAAVATALGLDEDAIGAGAPALAIASTRHETQYTRLFRS